MAKRRIKLKKRIVEMLELPEETGSDIPRVTLFGDEARMVENHHGVFEYSDGGVRLFSGAGLLRIEGRGLVLKQMSADRLYISGDIGSVGFENHGLR